MHSDYTKAGHQRHTNDGYWASVEARDERDRFAEWKASLPKVELGPLPSLPDTKDCKRYHELTHKILTYPGLACHALTSSERAELDALSSDLFDH